MAATPTNLRWTDRIKSLIQIKDFRLMLAAGGLDNTGRWMDTVVMGLLVLDLTDSAFQVALLFVFRWIPMLAFAFLSGMVADRANRWIVMMVARTVAVAAARSLQTGQDTVREHRRRRHGRHGNPCLGAHCLSLRRTKLPSTRTSISVAMKHL